MMSLHVLFAVVSLYLFSADVSALRGAATPSFDAQYMFAYKHHFVILSASEALFAGAFLLLVLGATLFIIIRTLRYLPWPLPSWFLKIIDREIDSRIDPTKSEHIASILDPWLSKIIDREISSRIAQTKLADGGNQGGSLTTSNGTTQSGTESKSTPRVMLTSAHEHQKLKDQYDELSTEVGFRHEQLGKKVTALEASILNLTKQGIARDDRCAKSSIKHLELLKNLELRVADHQSIVTKDRLRLDNLVPTLRDLESKLIAVVNAHTIASQPAESSTQLPKVEPANSQLEKRISELKQSQLVAAKRLDGLELRSRLNASIVDQLKENLGPGYRAMEANLTASQNRMMNALHQQRDKLQASISDQRSYINAQISVLPQRTEDAAECTGDRLNGESADVNACQKQVTDNDSLGSSATDTSALALEKYTQKLKEIVTASKKKFDEHATRILGLEAAVFKPAQDALPTEDRLDNLEYDVQKLKDEGRGETPDLRELIEQVNTVQEDISRLRIDVRTALNKAITKESHRHSLAEHEEFKQLATSRLEAMEQERANASGQAKGFEMRLQRMRNDCDGLVTRTKQLVESQAVRLSNLEAVLKEASESFSICLVQIEQQVELLETDFASLNNGMLKRITYPPSAMTNKELVSDLMSGSESDCSIVALHVHLDQVGQQMPSTSAGRLLSTASRELGVIDTTGPSVQHQPPTPNPDTASPGHSYQSVNITAGKQSTAEDRVEKHDSVSLTLPTGFQSDAFTPPYDPQGENLSGDLPACRIAFLNERINTVEQNVMGLIRHMQSSSSATMGSSDMSTRRLQDLQEAAAHTLLTTNSSSSQTLLPLPPSETISSNGNLSLLSFLTSDHTVPIDTSAQSSRPHRLSGSVEERQHREEDPASWVATSIIWQLSAEEGYMLTLKAELQRLKVDVDKRLSRIETVTATVGNSTFGDSPSAESSIISSQHPVPLSPVGSPTHVTTNSETAHVSDLAVPGPAIEWKATVTELRAKLEEVQSNLLNFEALIGREFATLSAFKREIQDKWSRQLGSLPPASMVNELSANYRALTNRLNSLEYSLRYRRLI